MKADLGHVPDILKVNPFKGKKVLTFERLREISICLSNLSLEVELPIIRVLLECEELNDEPSERKSLVLNSVLDCLRVGLPVSSEYYSKIISESELGSYASKNVNLNIVNGVQEHIESVLRCVANENPVAESSSSAMTAWIYSLERMSEDRSRVLVCILENLYPKELRRKKVVSTFKLYLSLLEGSLIRSEKKVVSICKDTLAGLLYSSAIKDYKSEVVLALLVRLSVRLCGFEVGSSDGLGFVSNICSILARADASNISYFTNKLLLEAVKYTKSRLNASDSKKEPTNKGDDRYWWRNSALMMPLFIREMMNENAKEQEVSRAIIGLVYFLNNIDSEYVQAVVTQFICDLKERNDRSRLETVRLVSRLVLFSYTGDDHLEGVLVGRGASSDRLNDALLDSWISRLNDKQSEIRNNVLSTLNEIISSFASKEFSYDHIKIVKTVIQYGHISCPNIRENIIVSLSNWVTHVGNGKHEDQTVSNTTSECISYLLRHISDRNRNIRLFLIGYFKNYKTEEVINNLWLLWYISYKQNDVCIRNIIEEVLVEFDSFEILAKHLESNGGGDSNKSSATAYKIIKAFISQRFELHRSFRLLIISMCLNKKNSGDDGIFKRHVHTLKSQISNKIAYFGDTDESGGNDLLLDEIEGTLFNKGVLSNWSALLGLDFNEKGCNSTESNVVEELTESIGHKNKTQLRRVLSYIHLFGADIKHDNLLGTILCPNVSGVNCLGGTSYKQESETNIDKYAIEYILKLQFKYMVNCIHYIMNEGTRIVCEMEARESMDYLNYIVGLYNQMEVFKLYENCYFASKSTFKNKLIRYLHALNLKTNVLKVLCRKMSYGCFSDKRSKNNFMFEAVNEPSWFGVPSRFIVCRIFNSIDSSLLNSTLFKRDSMYSSFALEKKKPGPNGKSRCDDIDMFILFLEIEKKKGGGVESNQIGSDQVEHVLNELNDKLLKELRGDGLNIRRNMIEILKLIRAINHLFFKQDNIDEEKFSEYFGKVHALFDRYLVNSELGTRDGGNSEFVNKYQQNKFLIEYVIFKGEYDKENDCENIENNVKLFGFDAYFELINSICFSELRDFFRKNHLNMLRLFELNDNDVINRGKIAMFSRLIVPTDREKSKSILTTTLGRSIGIFVLPILSIYALNETDSFQKTSKKESKDRCLLESILNIFFDSAVNNGNCKSEQLHCVIDCVLSAFTYYISVTNSIARCNYGLSVNKIVHNFVRAFYNQLNKKISGKFDSKGSSEKIFNIGLYCISLLEELSINHEIMSEDSKQSFGRSKTENKPSLSDFCSGLQLNFSYFFISRDDPEIYKRGSTDVFDLWNYLLNTSKYRIPSYLFARTNGQRGSCKSNIAWNVPGSNNKGKNAASGRVKRARKTNREFSGYGREHINDENEEQHNSRPGDSHCVSSDESEEYGARRTKGKLSGNANLELRRSSRLKNRQFCGDS
ncbi:hypothetical protein FG386_002111 [Cryptosporidium ryanae]|uniref:uncharacterized protein n=1 Tax=Cryptosporidium ryanae TaxID=515981 RepID=UPI00351A3E69|nr:hypothetical protein FG386_002111 [Cryptosporidium ryanae]